jgi:phage gp36-like protein
MYCTTDDMRSLFEYEDLVKATNLDDPNASEINEPRLEQACEAATGVVDGWLLRRFSLPLTVDEAALLNVLRSHTAILAMEWLGGADDILIAKANDTREWLRTFTDPNASGNGNAIADIDDLSIDYGFSMGGFDRCGNGCGSRSAELFKHCYW